MPTPPRLHKPNATIILKIATNSKKYYKIWKKSFPLVYRACRDESIDI